MMMFIIVFWFKNLLSKPEKLSEGWLIYIGVSNTFPRGNLSSALLGKIGTSVQYLSLKTSKSFKLKLYPLRV